MNTMSCDELREIAPEVALDLLTGAERAAALAHLEECQPCRAEVASLATTADALLAVAPAVEPPAGFTEGVLRQLGEQTSPPRPANVHALPRRVLALAAAAAIAIIAIAGVVTFSGDRATSTEAATIRSGAGVVVGRATVSDANPEMVALDMRGWTDMLRAYGAEGARSADLVVTDRDGTRHTVTIPVEERAEWTATFAVPGIGEASSVSSIAIRGRDGALWCAATFT